MSEFTVTGRYRARDGWQSFTKTVDAQNENVAREHIYSLVGSQHAVKRTEVELETVEEVTAA
jgi:large subunit ribosomal protein LX